MRRTLILGSFIAISLNGMSQTSQNTAGQTGFGPVPVFCNPTNRVEITSTTGDPYFNVVTTNGSSGLKLTNLPNIKMASPGNGKVLSTDGSGNVILVDDLIGTPCIGCLTGALNGVSVFGGNTVEFGNVFGGTSANLLSNREVPQNNFSILFSGNNINDRIKLGGTSTSPIPDSRLYIENHKPLNQTFSQFPGLHVFSDADANENVGGLIQLQDKNASNFAQENRGLDIETSGLGNQYGAFINATSNANSSSSICHGIKLTAVSLGNATEACGVAATASSNGAPLAVGIRAVAAGAGVGGTNHGGIFSANGNNQFPSALNIGVKAKAENVEANANGISASVFPSNALVQPNSTHKGMNIVVSTANNTSAIQDLEQYGIKSEVSNGPSSQSGKIYGVHSRAWNESQLTGTGFMNFGVFATAETSKIINGASGTESNIAVYASTSQLNNNNQQTVGNNSWAGWFDGDVYIGGSGTAGGGGNHVLHINGTGLSTNPSLTFSDRRFKYNINKMEDVINKIKKLNGYTYTYKTSEFKDLHFSDKEQIGLIAQELQEVFPQLVSEQKNGYLAVNYQGVVPILLEVAKEQQTQIENRQTQITSQQLQIDELKALVQSLTSSSLNKKTINNSVAIGLNDKNVIVLDQNIPNPFAESTVIN